MIIGAATLLREWEFLQNRVVPSLLDVDASRTARSWSIGSIEDAVAVGLAYEHARPSGAGQMEMYAGYIDRRLPVESGFSTTDLTFIPEDDRSLYFVRHQRKWLVDDDIAERVFLADPADSVDLVTYRSTHSAESRSMEEAVRCLRSSPPGRPA
jgi:hypothetical protein